MFKLVLKQEPPVQKRIINMSDK